VQENPGDQKKVQPNGVPPLVKEEQDPAALEAANPEEKVKKQKAEAREHRLRVTSKADR